jgi:hypothetical protein
MADKPSDRVPDAIKNHKPVKTHEMPGPAGAGLRKANAEKQVHQDFTKLRRENMAERVKLEKSKIAEKEHVREGKRGRLGKEFNEPNKERER